jgi:hypothetical protein
MTNNVFKPFEEAREYARSLNLSKVKDWHSLGKAKKLPSDIPALAHHHYRDSGWVGYKDFLGIKDVVKKYISFEEAREYARTLDIKTSIAWREITHPADIPSDPYYAYRAEWISWADYLGCTPFFTSRREGFLNYEEAREYVVKLNITSHNGWIDYCKSGERPANIPAHPQVIYKDKGWVSWFEWLYHEERYLSFEKAREWFLENGINTLTKWNDYKREHGTPINIPTRLDVIYKDSGWEGYSSFFKPGIASYAEAKSYAQSNGIGNRVQWRTLFKDGKLPSNMPLNPDLTYYQDGWEGWLVFCNTRKTYEEASEYARTLNLRNGEEWAAYHEFKKMPQGIPRNPRNRYLGRGWVNWKSFLKPTTEKSVKGKKPLYYSYSVAVNYASTLGLTTKEEWYDYHEAKGGYPIGIPKKPQLVYKKDGWVDWGYFLHNAGVHKPYTYVKQYIATLNMKTYAEWVKYWFENPKPVWVPSNPDITYQAEWNGWGDFLTNHGMSYSDFKSLLKKNGITSKGEYNKFSERHPELHLPQDLSVYQEYYTWGDAMKIDKHISIHELETVVVRNKITTRKEYQAFRLANKDLKLPSDPRSAYRKIKDKLLIKPLYFLFK